MHPITTEVLIALQCFVVLFVAFHNWVPLGTLNNLKGVRAEFSIQKLLVTTLVNLTPFAIGLAASVFYLVPQGYSTTHAVGKDNFFGRSFPGWLFWWLWATYGLACYGSLKAWWIPYLFRAEPERAARYEVMYAGTHSFFPERNGIRPNTLHVIFDAVTVAVIIALAVLTG